MSDFYDRNGQPLALEEWCQLFEQMEYRRVQWTDLPDGRWVSTIWLGLDHALWEDDQPKVFETVVGPSYEETWRYSSEQEALRGHQAAVDQLLGASPKAT